MTSQPISVLIVDDHAVVRRGLLAMFAMEDDFKVAGEASNGLEAVAQVKKLRPDVVLMDLRMPEMDGVGAMREITADDPDAKFIVLTTFDTDEFVFEAIEAGAKGYLLKDSSPDDLFRAVRAAHRGESLIEPGVAARVLARFAQLSRQASPADVLSGREPEVIQLMAKGAANKEIADELHITESTVKTHVTNIFQKLEARDRAHAITKAVQMRIIKL